MILLVRRIDRSALRAALPRFLSTHGAKVLTLHADADLGSYEAPSAADLAREACAELEARRVELLQKKQLMATGDALRRARFMESSRADDAFRALIQRCREAARRGRDHALAYQFPSAILTDRGRTVHRGEPSWPGTLKGEPAAVYAAVERVLLPRGYTVEATILDYPEGLLGDVGLFLRWGRFGDA